MERTRALPRIIDTHVHLCRTTQEESIVFPRPGWDQAWYWANEERVIPYMDLWGVSHIVILNIMDTRRMIGRRLERSQPTDDRDKERVVEELREDMRQRVRRFNEWACDLGKKEPRIIPFVMVDPVLFGEQVVEELTGWLERGAKGVKIHPNICGHFPNDPRLQPALELCQARGVTVVTDTTARPDHTGTHWGIPENWVPVLERFPSIKLVMAHLPGGRWDERVEIAARFRENVWFDLSQGFVDPEHPVAEHRQLSLEEAPRVIAKIGVERVLFGSDGPGNGTEIAGVAAQVMQLPLKASEKERILSGNAVDLLGLT